MCVTYLARVHSVQNRGVLSLHFRNNREAAWREIAVLRDKAHETMSVDGALDIFFSHFHVSSADVLAMFTNENWRHAKLYGGNEAGATQLTA